MPIAYEPAEVVAFRYPNPANQWRGLSPLAAARLSADSASAALQSNRNIFANGIQLGGIVSPKNGVLLSPEQAKELETDLSRRFNGVDKAHRWGVMRAEVDVKQVGVTPKDAEFLGLLRWSLEDVCRAYSVPLDMVGGQRTYENLDAALVAAFQSILGTALVSGAASAAQAKKA
jgi:HK97 family phage portal protein